jgi:hypothetical protein
MRHPKHPASVRETNEFAALGGVRPKTITYKLDPETKFYRVLGYGLPADVMPE